MTAMIAPSATHRIWIAGDLADARRTIREFCHREGACFAVSPVDYIYTGGHETGVCVTLINYARFPRDVDQLRDQCERLAAALARDLHQRSYSIEGPDGTHYYPVTIPAAEGATA